MATDVGKTPRPGSLEHGLGALKVRESISARRACADPLAAPARWRPRLARADPRCPVSRSSRWRPVETAEYLSDHYRVRCRRGPRVKMNVSLWMLVFRPRGTVVARYRILEMNDAAEEPNGSQRT
jgi:hypothetical protein